MKELKLFYDREMTKVVGDIIEFTPIKAGEISKKILYVYNAIKFPLEQVTITIDGEAISIIKNIEELSPREMKELVLEFNPAIDIMEPLKTRLNVKIYYIIK